MSALRELYMTKGQGFVLVYSVSEPSSLKALLPIRDSINRAKDGANVRANLSPSLLHCLPC